MGHLHYGDRSYVFDDRALIHLQVVIGSKLRRDESFFLTWTTSEPGRSGRRSVWVHPGIPLVFDFTSTEPVRLNSDWLRVLTDSAHSGGGLLLTAEPAERTIDVGARAR